MSTSWTNSRHLGHLLSVGMVKVMATQEAQASWLTFLLEQHGKKGKTSFGLEAKQMLH